MPINNTTGNMYAKNPNIPKIRELAAPPIFPPMPKLLINKSMETASKIHRIISFSNVSSFGELFPPVLFLAEVFLVVFVFACVFLPAVCVFFFTVAITVSYSLLYTA
jgi:hypothetical protein